MKRTLGIVFVLTLLVCMAWAQAPQGAPAGAPAQPAAAGQAPRGGGRGAAIPPNIVTFEASSVSLKPGESFVLSWVTEAGAAVIDNGVGEVYPRGTFKITPKATATYTMTVGGTAKKSVTVTVAGTTPVTAAAAANTGGPKPIARIDGKPDFSGIYGFTGMAGFGRGARGDAPAQPASPFSSLPTTFTLKPGVDNRAVPNPAGGTSDCLPLPADTAFGVPYPFQIFQNKNYVLILNEYPGTFRIIPIDAAHGLDADPTWMGDSVGTWEGDTLVIDTIAYNGKHSIGGINEPSESFKTIERLTRTSASGLFYEIIYEDAEKATGKWRKTATYNADTRAGMIKIMEFICDNNRDYVPFFGPAGPPPAGQGRGAAPAAPAGAAPAGGQRQ